MVDIPLPTGVPLFQLPCGCILTKVEEIGLVKQVFWFCLIFGFFEPCYGMSHFQITHLSIKHSFLHVRDT